MCKTRADPEDLTPSPNMTYKETCEYLYASAPLFQQQGAGAYKEGLSTTLALDEHYGHPHRQFATIHVGGTNGKGSCSHTLAAVLQHAGYKVGLYTSPHLVTFRERIRVNGVEIDEQYVVDFVAAGREFFEPLHPSFFELATALAFRYFADCGVDIAIVEVGLGGRLDCTNIITPLLSVITNISLDHVALLGDTLGQIAFEKAGIIKPGVPVVIGETTPETAPVFAGRAAGAGAPIVWAEQEDDLPLAAIQPQLCGYCQERNTRTILSALRTLGVHHPEITFTDEDVREAFAHVVELTGLRGRWQQISVSPLTLCDTGHNVGGITYIVRQLSDLMDQRPGATLRMVFGMAGDKDITTVLTLLPPTAHYYFCQASVRRALPAAEMADRASLHGLSGGVYPTVAEAYRAAQADASARDVVFIGGSSFVVADLLTYLDHA